MKRIGTILILSIIIVLSSGSSGFAAGLSLVDIYPKEGESRLQPANVAVKMIFSENMAAPTAQAANAGSFHITDEKGKTVEYNALYNEKKYPNEVWLLITEPLEADSRYTLTISKDLQSSAGSTLDEDVITHFAARNTKTDTNGYMFLMLLMVAGMVGFTIWDNRRKEKKDTKQDEDKKINPYKEARRTGKSVEEVVAKIEQEKARQERRKAKSGRGESDSSEDEARDGVYRLKKKQPIKDAGVATPKIVVARIKAKEKAEAEAKAAAEKRRKKQTAAKSKGSKQQRKKKK